MGLQPGVPPGTWVSVVVFKIPGKDTQMSHSNMACLDIESELLLSTKLLEERERVDCKRHAMF